MADINILKVNLFPLSDVHCGFGLQQGSVLAGLNYIPGRVLRGALAGWSIRNGRIPSNKEPLFKKLFQGSDFSDSGVSFPSCRLGDRFDLPASVFRVGKTGAQDPMHKLLAGKDDESVETDFTLADTGQPIDFLRSDKMPCEVHSQLSAAGGAVKDLQTGTELSEQAPSVLDMRNRHDPQSGRVGEDGLFAEEMIPYMGADSGFSGLLICTEEALRIFEPLASRCDPMNPDPLHVIFMGRRRSPVCISAERADHILDEVLNSFDLGAQNISISFHSEYLPSESEIFPLQDSHLQKDLDLPELEIKNKFCVRGMQHGFNVVKDEHGFDSPDTQKETTGMEARPCFSPGTCVFIDTKNKIGPEDKKRLAVLSLTGAGKDTVNGSGRFFINANIHGIQE